MKKSIKYFVIGFLLSIIVFIYNQFMAGKPSFMEEANVLKRAGGTQTFHVRLGSGKQDIGFVVSGDDFAGHRLNGEYIIEYIHDGDAIETRVINQDTIKDKGLYIITMGRVRYSRMPLDVISIPFKGYSKFDIKVTVKKPDSIFALMDKDLYFFKDKHNKGAAKILAELEEMDRKEALLYTTIDSKERNETLKPFHEALLSKEFKKIKEFIENDNNFTVNTNLQIGRNSAHYAAFNNDIKTLKYLVKNGVDIHKKDKLGQIPLAYAIETLSYETSKYLLENGNNMDEVKLVGRYFVERDAPYDIDENQTYQYKKSTNYDYKLPPLNYAVSMGSYKMTKLLLEHGATNYKDKKGADDSVYSFLYDIPNYKEMLKLLQRYKIPDKAKFLPTKKEIEDRYEGCSNRSFRRCGPISKVAKKEDMNISIYLDEIYFSNQRRKNKGER